MKACRSLTCLFFTSLFLSGGVAGAETAATVQPIRELAVVVIDNVQKPSAITDFDRIDMAFQHVAKQRKWPVKIVAERFASNLPEYDAELRVFNQRVREETSGDLTFRGWMILTVNGTKHDFGMVTFRYYRRAGENMDDVLDKIFRGAAGVAADKIEPILLPVAGGSKS
jgi:hypothetical protein